MTVLQRLWKWTVSTEVVEVDGTDPGCGSGWFLLEVVDVDGSTEVVDVCAITGITESNKKQASNNKSF